MRNNKTTRKKEKKNRQDGSGRGNPRGITLNKRRG